MTPASHLHTANVCATEADVRRASPLALVRSDMVPVRSHVRAKPVNAKREAVHEALRRAVEA